MHIDVTDTGPGIPEEFRDKIFERFWRGEHSQSGAGLGLSIARRVMALLGGTVSVSESPEGGTVFSLKFVSGVEETIRPHPAIMSDRDKTNDIETADWKFRVTG
jgi:signal transduction histidine kinase